jgi:hypothetical protein
LEKGSQTHPLVPTVPQHQWEPQAASVSIGLDKLKSKKESTKNNTPRIIFKLLFLFSFLSIIFYLSFYSSPSFLSY